MKITMVKLTNLKTGEALEMSEKKWKRESKGLPSLVGRYSVDRFKKEIQSFKFIAWVHPKKGGDDYQVEVDQPAKNLDEAKRNLESWLKTISNITTDYEVRS